MSQAKANKSGPSLKYIRCHFSDFLADLNPFMLNLALSCLFLTIYLNSVKWLERYDHHDMIITSMNTNNIKF